jgi:flagellar biosynthesis protein FlhG
MVDFRLCVLYSTSAYGFPIPQKALKNYLTLMWILGILELASLKTTPIKSMMSDNDSVQGYSATEDKLGLRKQIFAVASGKGGTGKSTVAINLSVALAAIGYEVILIDADLGGSDVSNLLGVNSPRYTLKDFVSNEVTYLAEILEPTPSPKLRLICGGSDIISVSNPLYQQKMRLIRNIARLEADYIIVDLGPDISFNNLDFFNAAPVRLLVTQNVDAIILGFYRFMKAAFVRCLKQEFKNEEYVLSLIGDFQNLGWSRTRRNLIGAIRAASQDTHDRLDHILATFQPKLVFNMVDTPAARRTADQMFSFILENFGFRLQTVAFIPRDRDVQHSYARSEPFILRSPKSDATKAIFDMITACGLNRFPNGERMDNFIQFSRQLKIEAQGWQLVKI